MSDEPLSYDRLLEVALRCARMEAGTSDYPLYDAMWELAKMQLGASSFSLVHMVTEVLLVHYGFPRWSEPLAAIQGVDPTDPKVLRVVSLISGCIDLAATGVPYEWALAHLDSQAGC